MATFWTRKRNEILVNEEQKRIWNDCGTIVKHDIRVRMTGLAPVATCLGIEHSFLYGISATAPRKTSLTALNDKASDMHLFSSSFSSSVNSFFWPSHLLEDDEAGDWNIQSRHFRYRLPSGWFTPAHTWCNPSPWLLSSSLMWFNNRRSVCCSTNHIARPCQDI